MELWRQRLEPLDASVHLNISADEHLPAGTENPWTTWKALNRLRTQVGRSRVNMLKWGGRARSDDRPATGGRTRMMMTEGSGNVLFVDFEEL